MENLLNKINPYKAPSEDEINDRIPKEINIHVSIIFSLYIAKVLQLGSHTERTKHANVVPVCKTNNYSQLQIDVIILHLLKFKGTHRHFKFLPFKIYHWSVWTLTYYRHKYFQNIRCSLHTQNNNLHLLCIVIIFLQLFFPPLSFQLLLFLSSEI